jgi:hypothetical protein
VRRLIRLPPNDWFYSAFRAWYVIAHVTDIMPRRPEPGTWWEAALSIFGVYRGREAALWSPPPPSKVEWVSESTDRTSRAELLGCSTWVERDQHSETNIDAS